MSDNLELWNRFADIDPEQTKPITGKPYKGTSPKPQYVIRCLTEMFGPVGQGFGWEVLAEGFTPLGDEILHWCRIRFWHGDGPGFESYGQTMARMSTKSGMRNDEDAPKKSLTDAVTKAASQIGIASNIFMGRWDDSRYVDAVNAEYREAEKPKFDPAAFRDRVKAKIEKARTLPDLQAAFREAWGERDNLHPAMVDELTKAKDVRKAELSPLVRPCRPPMTGMCTNERRDVHRPR